MKVLGNIFDDAAGGGSEETFETLKETDGARVERIVSTGQCTPAGEWLDQSEHEWVIMLSGGAGLRFEGSGSALELSPGDYLEIPAGCRHRVEWTDPAQATVWLAFHYRSD